MLTHNPPSAAPNPDITFVDDLARAIQAAKDAAGGKYVNVLGANVAKQCLEAGRLDEILALIAPVLLGDGLQRAGCQARVAITARTQGSAIGTSAMRAAVKPLAESGEALRG